MHYKRTRWLTGLVLCCSLQGCSGLEQPQVDTLTPPHGPLPACAEASTSITRPSEFPARFPLPPGVVITRHEWRTQNRLIIYTVVPYDWQTTLTYLNKAVPGAGFELSGGEMEIGLEAESDYAGNGYRGRWVLHAIAGCPDVSTLTVLSAPR